MLPLLSLPSGQEYKPQIALCLTHPESLSEAHTTAVGWEEILSAPSTICSRISAVAPPHVLVHVGAAVGEQKLRDARQMATGGLP